MIEELRGQLFENEPKATLYHYTSLQGLMGIIESRKLRASDVRYMNDSTELTYALNLLQNAINDRTDSTADERTTLSVFSAWLRDQINTGPMLFSASFRANGNLLSQWRGYSNHGKGISLGFNPTSIKYLASQQQFSLGQCLYDIAQQRALAEKIITGVISMCTDPAQVHSVLDSIEGDLLGICALLKHPAFAEEQEWRLISPTFLTVDDNPISFREGKAMLIPFYLFDLEQNGTIDLDHVFVGPTPNADLSVNALKHYLMLNNAHPSAGISDSHIPYRPR